MTSYIGEVAALATSLFWAISVVFFKQLSGLFSPLNLNLWKGIISVVGLGVTLFFVAASIPE